MNVTDFARKRQEGNPVDKDMLFYDGYDVKSPRDTLKQAFATDRGECANHSSLYILYFGSLKISDADVRRNI